MDEIIQYQKDLFKKFTKKYIFMINKLDKLNNNNIEILNKFNNDFRVTIDMLEELDLYLEDENEETKRKIKEYKDMNDTIKQFIPLMLVNNIIKNIHNVSPRDL